MPPGDIVSAYHQRSKHQLERYAPGPDGLDWASQPDPFRRFAGAPFLEFPLLADELPVSWDQLFVPAGVPPQALDLEHLGQLFELSLGLSAWKVYGNNRWALRCNPSSGNLHPSEGYLICPALPGLPAGVHHYRPDRHGLEQRAAAPLALRGGVLVALTGIHWREAWKYGLRAFRYCQHDAGHALAALAYAAALNGWPVRQLSDWSDDEIAALCGINRQQDFPPGDGETPEALLWIGAGTPPTAASVLTALDRAQWSGQANELSPTHRDWPDIPAVADASRRPGGLPIPVTERPSALADAYSSSADSGSTAADPRSADSRLATEDSSQTAGEPPTLPELPPAGGLPASRLIRRRRSAQAFDGINAISKPHFYRLLDALLPRPHLPPWSLLATPPAVHPVLFVHRVDGLPPGIYCLPRAAAALPELRAVMRPDWLWQRVTDGPAHLPLYLLAPLETRAFAATASCHQDIAADSAFMVAMLARFDDIAAQPWRYGERFREAGMLGQVLYLEAEAGGLQGTGIGCYFDDVVHRALGLDTSRFQDLYHFTVGRAVIDQRLGSETGYAALALARQSPAHRSPDDPAATV